MPFHTDTNIIPGESLGGITLGDPLTHYWDDITHYQETSGNLHYWMDGRNSIVYELVDCFIEFRVHMPSCRIDRIAALPGFQGAFQNIEAYSAAGKTWFGWWLVEHYLPYHVNCPNSCGLGEPTRGRKDPPYFQMSYGPFDNIPDLVDPLVESPLPLQQGFTRSSLERCITS
mgnify:CR=1 FL=1